MKNIQGSWKEKLEYIWMYYKLPILGVIIGCVVISSCMYAKATEKEDTFQAMLLDIHTNENEEKFAEEFTDFANVDTDKYEVLTSTSLLLSDASSGNYALTSLSKFYSLIGTEDLDVCMMLEDDFKKYCESDCYLDLREIFSEEELSEFPALYQDEEGHVLGIYGEELKKIQSMEGYEGKTSMVGIVYNTRHQELAAEFLRFLNESN